MPESPASNPNPTNPQPICTFGQKAVPGTVRASSDFSHGHDSRAIWPLTQHCTDMLFTSMSASFFHDYTNKQEGLAVASMARDDPSSLPGMHRDHSALPSQTDRRTLIS